MSVNSVNGCPNQVVVYKNPNSARNKGFIAGAVAPLGVLATAAGVYQVASRMKSHKAQKLAECLHNAGGTICDNLANLGNKMQNGLLKGLDKAKAVVAKNPKIGQALLPFLALGAVGAVIGAIIGHAKKN